MKKRRLIPKKQTNLKGFVSDLRLLDRKLLLLVITISLIAFFIRQNVSHTPILGAAVSFFEKPEILSSPTDAIEPALYPKKLTDGEVPPISAESAIVIDVASQVVLYAKREDIRFPSASTTKIMTALVAMDYFSPNDIITVPAFSVEGAVMKLVPEEQISFEGLLYGLLLASGNDAAETIARQSPLGRQGFIAKMNEKARALHLTNTFFEDPTGLSIANYTSAIDLARLATLALKNETLRLIVSTKTKTVSDLTGQHTHELENLNKLLGVVEGVMGLKTGFTQEAGQVLVTAVSRNGHTIVTVVLRSEDRFADSRELLEWVFRSHTFTPANLD